ncbi:MAG: PEP-CTERM sorting domain-containing protein [Chthoniobacterales bacterium]
MMKTPAVLVALGVAVAGLIFSSPARAQAIATRAQLDTILSDQMQLEDFEGVSLAGGSSLQAPNPLNSMTQPNWGLLSGITYSSPGSLTLYSSSSNILQGTTSLTITFNQPQLAMGLSIIDQTGNLTYHDVVSFYNGNSLLGSLPFDLAPASMAFAGWQAPGVGITRVVITSDQQAVIDDVEWGRAVVPEPGTMWLAAVGGAALLAYARKRRQG